MQTLPRTLILLLTAALVLLACESRVETVGPPGGDASQGQPLGPGQGETPRGTPRPLIMAQPLLVRTGGGDIASLFPDGVRLRAFSEHFRGPELLLTPSVETPSGAYGLVLDRPAEPPISTTLGFSIEGERQWEIGLDVGNDASGQGLGPDYVLAFDNSPPTGDRFRMAPGGYTIHSPVAGTPDLDKRFHIVGGSPEEDGARHVLYVQAGSEGKAGVAEWLIRGQGQDPDTREWGSQVFGVTADGTVEAERFTAVATNAQRDVVRILKGQDSDRAWLHWRQASSNWRMGIEANPPDLHLRFNESLRFSFETDGTGFADEGWVTFSPVPPKPRDAMTLVDWLDWAYRDAAKPVKPYDGIPKADHPAVRRIAERTGRDAGAVAAEEQRRYGKDISRIAIGTANWAHALTRAIREARDFDALRAAVNGESPPDRWEADSSGTGDAAPGARTGAAAPGRETTAPELRAAVRALRQRLAADPDRPVRAGEMVELTLLLERTLRAMDERR